MRFELLSISDFFFSSQGIPSKVFEKTESTSTLAKADASKVTAPLAVYISTFQTAGRGRGTNTWVSNPGEAFLTSWSYAVGKSPQPIMSPLIGLAIYEAACGVWPQLKFSLKAPNDIYINDKKVIGILLEVVEGASTRLIVSFGCNVFGSPASVPTATSLCAEHPGLTSAEWKKFLSHSSVKIKTAVLAGTQKALTRTACDGLLKALNSHPNLLDKVVSVDPDGSLRFASGSTANWQTL